jgi:hypothetical protein
VYFHITIDSLKEVSGEGQNQTKIAEDKGRFSENTKPRSDEAGAVI